MGRDRRGGLIALLVGVNVVGVKEAARLNVVLAVIDFATQALLVVLGFVLVFSPEILVDNVDFGVAPTWESFFLAIPVAMIAYTGIETISNLSEEARDPSRDIAALHPPGRGRRLRHLLHPAGDRPLGPSGLGGPRRVHDPGRAPEEGGFANDPVLGIVDNLGVEGGSSPSSRSTSASWPRPSSSSPPTRASSARRASPTRWPATGSSRALPPPAPPLQDAVARAGAVRGRGPIVAILPGETVFLGTMYSFGAMLSFTVAHVALVALARCRDEELVYRARPNVRLRGVDSAAVRDPRRARDRPGVARGGDPGAGHAVGGPRLAGARVRRLLSSTAAACCACPWPRPSAPRRSC